MSFALLPPQHPASYLIFSLIAPAPLSSEVPKVVKEAVLRIREDFLDTVSEAAFHWHEKVDEIWLAGKLTDEQRDAMHYFCRADVEALSKDNDPEGWLARQNIEGDAHFRTRMSELIRSGVDNVVQLYRSRPVKVEVRYTEVLIPPSAFQTKLPFFEESIAIESPRTIGCVIWGPYQTLAAGKYVAEILFSGKGRPPAGALGEVDIVLDGEKVAAAALTPSVQLNSKKPSPSLEFEVDQETLYEIRLFVTQKWSDFTLRFLGVRLKRLVE